MFLLEYLRVVFILIFGTVTLTFIEEWIYKLFNASIMENPLNWMAIPANIIIILVLYRNKLQFSGWIRRQDGKRLTKTTSGVLMALAIMLLLVPLLKAIILRRAI